jgi:hypothetical protein
LILGGRDAVWKCLGFAAVIALFVVGAAAQTIPVMPPGAEAAEARLLVKVGPQTRAFIRQEVARQRGNQVFSESLAAPIRRNVGNLGDADIEALTFLIMMEAAKSQQEDLKAIMDGVKAINDAKETSRRGAARSGSPNAPRPRVAINRAMISVAPRSKQDIDNQIDRVKNDLDSMSEMGEMESLRLQMAMDRMSKLMQTLSNLSKKISDTNATITQNLK